MDDDDEYTIPLQDQRVFGAGIKRKRIAFVPAASAASPAEGSLPRPTSSAADRYLSIVLPKQENPGDPGIELEPKAETLQCAVCRQPVAAAAATTTTTTAADEHAGGGEAAAAAAATAWHESSIAHQVCLEHSRPPSHLDRSHVGVRYLAAYGWDPDSGRGLGARGEGIRMPIKARKKNDTVGLRERVDEDDEYEDGGGGGGGGMGETQTQKQKQRQKQKKEAKKREEEQRLSVRLNAKELRKREMAAKERAEALRAAFYNDVDVDKYLGSGENQRIDYTAFKGGGSSV